LCKNGKLKIWARGEDCKLFKVVVSLGYLSSTLQSFYQIYPILTNNVWFFEFESKWNKIYKNAYTLVYFSLEILMLTYNIYILIIVQMQNKVEHGVIHKMDPCFNSLFIVQ